MAPHVSGTVAAVAGNSTGVAGVAPTAKVVPVRVLAKCGGSLSDDIADAIIWAAGGTVSGIPANANPAKVINMSLGGSGSCGTTYQAAIDSAVSRGTTVVVAAGNSNQDASGFRPANCNSVVTVAASNPSGSLSYYSNYGATVDLTAPGVRHQRQRRRHPLHDQHRNHDARRGRLRQLPGHLDGDPARRRPRGPDEVQVPRPHPGPGRVHAPAGHPGHAGRLHQGLRSAGLSDATATMGLLGGTTPPPSGNLLLNPGFESGSASWTSDHADTFETGTNARTGSGFAGLNGWGQATSRTRSTRPSPSRPPSAASSLSFYLKTPDPTRPPQPPTTP